MSSKLLGVRCRHRGAVVDADAPEAGELDARMAQIETRDQSEKIELYALNPAELEAEQAEQRGFDASAAVGEPDIGVGAKILGDRVRRQRGLELRHGPQNGRHEGIAVRP